MMEFFPLPIFPEGALDSSVITTVWIGVVIVALFNLRLGWVLSGLVVPGYLVPLLIARPYSAGVVLFEAILTYLIVVGIAGPLARLHGWGSFFGRDRFFALVLVSVIVRVMMDGWLLPRFGAWFTGEFGIPFDYRNNLHSFGLIIIALIANQFWKTGLVRGLIPLTVTVGLTYLIVRFVLMELTNFRVSGLSYMFEDLTVSILSSPKAYIILLTTAFVASRMNLFYGWEFNGILIPSLLALQWYEPSKIVISFAEAFLILGVGTLLLRLPLFRDANIEGARKLVLFFNISFAWKILLSYGLIAYAPALKVSDFFAFGYLLSTLMAIKMHDKAIMLKVTWSTLTTSFVAIMIASVIGFALTLLPATTPPQYRLVSDVPAQTAGQPLTEIMKQEKRRMYGQIGQWEVPLPLELEAFREGVETLRRAKSVNDPYARTAARILSTINYEVIIAEDRFLVLRETVSRGWGIYVINPEARDQTLIEVPGPLHETGTLEAGLWAFLDVGQARAFAVGGPRRTFDRDAPIEVLNGMQSPFAIFHDVFDRRDTLQFRGFRPSLRRALMGTRDSDLDGDFVFVGTELPAGLNLGQLRRRAQDLEVRFLPLPESNDLRDRSRGAFAELVISSRSLRRMAAGLANDNNEVGTAESERLIEGYLEDWLLSEVVRIAPRGSEVYEPPDVYELLFFDEEVITPLLQVLADDQLATGLSEQGLDLLDEISRRASQYQYRITRYRHQSTGSEYVILGPKEETEAPFWGTYVFRAGDAADYMVQVPRPLYERSSLEFGLHLFERISAASLLISGTHPFANSDGSADLTRFENRVNLFNLVNQVVVRESGARPLTVVQVRSQGVSPFRPVPEEDLVVSVNTGIGARADQSPGVRALLNQLENDGLSFLFTDGGAATSGLEAVNNFQSLYQRASQNKSFAMLWLSPLVLEAFDDQSENMRRLRDMRDSGIDVRSHALRDWIRTQPLAAYTPPVRDRELVRRYTANGDIIALTEYAAGRQLTYISDVESRQGFLAVWQGDTLVALANLTPLADEIILTDKDSVDVDLRNFLNRRSAWLLFQ